MEKRNMKRFFIAIICLNLFAEVSLGQKGKADADYYPLGYSGDTWTGEVTAFDNEQRTLTLTYVGGNNPFTFVAVIPDAPYEWRRDARNFRVVDFPYDKQAKNQVFKYTGPGDAATIMNESGSGMKTLPNPPDSNVISDLTDFKGRRITVYYTTRDRTVNGTTQSTMMFGGYAFCLKKRKNSSNRAMECSAGRLACNLQIAHRFGDWPQIANLRPDPLRNIFASV